MKKAIRALIEVVRIMKMMTIKKMIKIPQKNAEKHVEKVKIPENGWFFKENYIKIIFK